MGQGIDGTDSVSTCAHGGIYSVNHRLVKVDCSSSVNPLGISPRALRAILKGAGVLSSTYPDPECSELKKSLARYVGIDQDHIVVGNGAVEIIYWFAQEFAGRYAVVPVPTFCEYELASLRTGAHVRLVKMHDFTLDSDSILKAARGADTIFLCNPNNPTGLLATSEIESIVSNAGRQTMILVDECFIELVQHATRNSLVKRVSEFENLVVLRSLTKSFALAGLRVGYAVCRPQIAERLKRHRIPWNVNGLAQAAGIAALSDTGYLRRARQLVSREKEFLHARLGKLNSFICHESDANFFMINLRDRNSTKFRNGLLKKTGVLVRDCSTFTGMDSHHIRIAVKNRRENLVLLDALEAFSGNG